MSILKFSFFIIITTSLIFQSCSRLDDSGIGCPPKIDSIYYRLDSMAKSLVKVYHAGDTLKLKDSTGVIYYFIAQKPDSGFSYEKDPESIYTNCPGNDWFLGFYKIQLNNIKPTIGPIIIKEYYTPNSYSKNFEIEFKQCTYRSECSAFPLPPSPNYIDSIFVNNNSYRNVVKMGFGDDWPPKSYSVYNRTDGLIQIITPYGEIFNKVQ